VSAKLCSFGNINEQEIYTVRIIKYIYVIDDNYNALEMTKAETILTHLKKPTHFRVCL
jgi:hypothetical protein